jgi:hypothetical protein
MLTIAITAATPIITPSIVKVARVLLRASARKAMRIIIKKFIVKTLQGARTARPQMSALRREKWLLLIQY